MEVSVWALRPGLSNPRERGPGTHWTGRWMGPTTGLDLKKSEISFQCRISKHDSSVARPVGESLHQLCYPGSSVGLSLLNCKNRTNVRINFANSCEWLPYEIQMITYPDGVISAGGRTWLKISEDSQYILKVYRLAFANGKLVPGIQLGNDDTFVT